MRRFRRLASLLFVTLAAARAAVQDPTVGSLNKPDRIEWFRDQGFGLFIHWSVDVQLGVGISHSLVGASDDYTNAFFNELPKTFDPKQFDPEDWARLAKLAGVRYVMFTTKHHSGFAMFDTTTTPFGVMNTPFHRDITAEVFKAFRDEDIAPGVYFSPDDFYWLHKNGKLIQRNVPEVQPMNNPGLMDYDLAQVRELLTNYGPISLIFFDGQANGLRDLAWKLQPDIVVTRGGLQTPEQYVPGMPLKGAWEANLRWEMRGSISHRTTPINRGGNLYAFSSKPGPRAAICSLMSDQNRTENCPSRKRTGFAKLRSGCLSTQKRSIVCVPGSSPMKRDVWFTKKKNEDTLYAMVDSDKPWEYGKWNDLVLHSVKASDQTEVSVLGENGKVLEYQPSVNPKPTWGMKSDGLHIRAMHTPAPPRRSQMAQPNRA